MTALLRSETVPLGPPSPTAERVDHAVRRLEPVDLATLDAGAALLTRMDRKYVVPVATFERLVADLDEAWQVLEIARRRVFGYSSVYFDTDDFSAYRAHLQGRRRRHKVRVRRYLDSEDCMLEVKLKGDRGATVKRRRPHSSLDQARLGLDGRAWVDGCVRGHGDDPAESEMRPVVTTVNRRTTLTDLAAGARLTVDTDLTTGWDDACAELRPGLVLLESKVAGHGSEADRLLRAYGVRPVSVSKYCVGVASLGTGLPANPWHRTIRTFFDTTTHEENR